MVSIIETRPTHGTASSLSFLRGTRVGDFGTIRPGHQQPGLCNTHKSRAMIKLGNWLLNEGRCSWMVEQLIGCWLEVIARAAITATLHCFDVFLGHTTTSP